MRSALINGERVDIKEVVNDAQWQRMRRRMKGTWSTSVGRNVKELRDYVRAKEADTARLVRVLNYLTGTAFRIGAINDPRIDRLRSYVARRYRASITGGKK